MAEDQKNVVAGGRHEGVGAGRVGLPCIILMSIYVIIVSVALVYMLATLWPDRAGEGSKEPASAAWSPLWWEFDVSGEVRLLLIVVFAGALGGQVRSLRSLAWYVGNRELVCSWLLQYILTPFVGATLAIVLYFVIRAGFFSTEAGTEQTSVYGFAGLAGLAGIASEQAVLKLKAVAETFFTKPPEGADSKPQT